METKFPKVEIEAFMEASDAVEALENSGTFASTHAAVSRLLNCENFSTNQVKRIIVAGEENHQVNWILSDADITELFTKLKNEYSEFLFAKWQQRLNSLIESEEKGTGVAEDEDEDYEIPF